MSSGRRQRPACSRSSGKRAHRDVRVTTSRERVPSKLLLLEKRRAEARDKDPTHRGRGVGGAPAAVDMIELKDIGGGLRPGDYAPPCRSSSRTRSRLTELSLEALTRAFLPSARARMSRSGFCGRIFQASPEAQSCLRPADGSHKGEGLRHRRGCRRGGRHGMTTKQRRSCVVGVWWAHPGRCAGGARFFPPPLENPAMVAGESIRLF